jgi:tetratricopeptide (TPR) repeat protein
LAQVEIQQTVAYVVKHTAESVVQIVISDSTGQETALGSGFLVSADGKIVTNYHVIKGANSATVKLSNGSIFPVNGVLAVDQAKDLALLKVAGKNLPFVSLAINDAPRVGDRVVAIGSPLGLEGTVSDGIVSAFREDAKGNKWIQTTAPVSHGNSGGPLLDMNGKVVGVITLGVDPQLGQNLNFATPSREVKPLLAISDRQLLSLDSVYDAGSSTPGTRGIENTHIDATNAGESDERGDSALQARQYEQAMLAYRESVRINPNDARAWQGLGSSYLALQQYSDAVKSYEEASKRAPKDPHVWRSLGLAYTGQAQYNNALSAFQLSVGLNADDTRCWYDLAQTYRRLGNVDQAIRAYRQIIQLKPDSPRAWYELGSVLQATGNNDGAIEALRQAVHLEANDPDAWDSLARVLSSANHQSEAISAYKEVTRLRPTDKFAWGNLGQAYLAIDDYKNAEEPFKKAVEASAVAAMTTQDHTALDMIPIYWSQLALICEKLHRKREAQNYWQAIAGASRLPH